MVCANEIVEQFHEQLKTAQAVVGNLPPVLLSIQNIIKKDIGSTPSEIVFDTYLTVPSQHFEDC